VQVLELVLEGRTPPPEVPPGQGVVGLPPTDTQPQSQPTTRQLVDRRRLLGQLGGGAGRGDEDVAQEADAFGDRAGCREDGELLMAGERDCADGGERAEARAVSAACPVQQLCPGGSRYRVGNADAHVHVCSFTVIWLTGKPY
jgi:hypothetical protein